jgi:hypothetical protein
MRKLLRKTVVPVVLSIIYFVVVSPVAFVLRLVGSDPMHRTFDGALESYRTTTEPTPRDGLKRPY